MPDKKYTIGVDVGGTKTAYGIYDEKQRLLLHRQHVSDTQLSPEPFFDNIADNILDMCREAGITPKNINGVGVALPSFIRADDDFVIKTANLPRIRDFYALEHLTKTLPGFSVAVGNDNHAAALAEYKYGAGRGHNNMLYCLMSTGLASGIIINGRLFRGTIGCAGESGHMIVTPNEGLLCGCGNRGCISAYASGAKIAEQVSIWLAEGEKSIISELASSEPVTAQHIDAAYQQGDILAARAITQMTKYMAVWLYNLYITLNINCFVFGGGLLRMKTPILSLVREQFNAFTSDEVSFCVTQLGDDFGVLAASCLPALL